MRLIRRAFEYRFMVVVLVGRGSGYLFMACVAGRTVCYKIPGVVERSGTRMWEYLCSDPWDGDKLCWLVTWCSAMDCEGRQAGRMCYMQGVKLGWLVFFGSIEL